MVAIIIIIVISGRSPCRTLPAKNARSPPGSAEANAGGEHAELLPKHPGITFATAAPTPSPFELLPQRQADHRALLQDRSGFQLAAMSPLLTRSGKGRVVQVPVCVPEAWGRWLNRRESSLLHPLPPGHQAGAGGEGWTLWCPAGTTVGNVSPDPGMTTCLGHVLRVPGDTWVPRLLLVGDPGEPSLLIPHLRWGRRYQGRGCETGELYRDRGRLPHFRMSRAWRTVGLGMGIEEKAF